MNRAPKVQQRTRRLADHVYRQRCYGCYRPRELCFCDSIPRVKNQTDVLILQHQRERSHPFNTARIVKQALAKCELIFDRNESFSTRQLPIGENAALLYPGKKSRLLNEVTAGHGPSQLVIIDGTWDQAKTLFRDMPQLQTLPQFRLAPSTPGQYRIRREPTDTSLSTLEATVQALQHLEPETPGLGEMISAFDTMVQQQLAHPRANYGDGSPEPKVNSLNIPNSLQRCPSKIVVAYGEAFPPAWQPGMNWSEFNRMKKVCSQQPPVFWIAQRLDGDSLIEAIEPAGPVSQANLRHFQLTTEDFANAPSVEEFRKLWAAFLRPDDLLVVPNQSTRQLLNNCDIDVADCVQLKSINFRALGKFHSSRQFLNHVQFPLDAEIHPSRAGARLASAVSLVRYLRQIR